jgi:hypothetical protein
MIKSGRIMAAALVVVLLAAAAWSAWAASGPEALLEQLVQKYMEQKFGASLKYIQAADPKVEKVKMDLKRGSLFAKIKGSFRFAGKRYNATYDTTWKDKNNCAYINEINFTTDMNSTVSTVASKAMQALYAKKCEKDQNLATAIRAAWLVKGLQP